MPTLSDATLLLYVAEALDPADAAMVRDAVAADPTLRTRLDALEKDLALLPGPASFRIPPPGLGLQASAGQPAVMGPASLRVGDSFQVHLEPRPAPEQDGVVVLRDLGEGWQVVSPARPAEAVSLARLPVESDGRHRVVLLARPPAGRQRWAVALVPLGRATPSDPPDAPWLDLQRGLADGSVPVGVVEIELG